VSRERRKQPLAGLGMRTAIIAAAILAVASLGGWADSSNDELSVSLYYEVVGGGLAGDASVSRGSDLRVFGIIENVSGGDVSGAYSVTLLAIRVVPEPQIQEVLGHQAFSLIPAGQSLGLGASTWETSGLAPGEYILKAILRVPADGDTEASSQIPAIIEDANDLSDAQKVLLAEDGRFLTFTGPAELEIRGSSFDPVCLPGIALTDSQFISTAPAVFLRLPVLNTGSVEIPTDSFPLNVDALGLILGSDRPYRDLRLDDIGVSFELTGADTTKTAVYPGDEGVVRIEFRGSTGQPFIDAFEEVFQLPSHIASAGFDLGGTMSMRIQLRLTDPDPANGGEEAVASPTLFVPSQTAVSSVSMRTGMWSLPIPAACDCGSIGTCANGETWEFVYGPVREVPSSFFLATVKAGAETRIYRVATDTGIERNHVALDAGWTISQPPVATWSIRSSFLSRNLITTAVFVATEAGLVRIPVDGGGEETLEAATLLTAQNLSLPSGVSLGTITRPLVAFRDTVYVATDQGLFAIGDSGILKWHIPASEIGASDGLTLGPVVTRWDGDAVFDDDPAVVWFLVQDQIHMVVDTEGLDPNGDKLADLDPDVYDTSLLDLELESTPIVLASSGGYRTKDLSSITSSPTEIEDPWRVHVAFKRGRRVRLRSLRVEEDSGAVSFVDAADATGSNGPNDDLLLAQTVYGVIGSAGETTGNGDMLYVYSDLGLYAYRADGGTYARLASFPISGTGATGGAFRPVVLNDILSEGEAIFGNVIVDVGDAEVVKFVGLAPETLAILSGCPWPSDWATSGSGGDTYPRLTFELPWSSDDPPLGAPVVIERAGDWAAVLVGTKSEIRAFYYPAGLFTDGTLSSASICGGD